LEFPTILELAAQAIFPILCILRKCPTYKGFHRSFYATGNKSRQNKEDRIDRMNWGLEFLLYVNLITPIPLYPLLVFGLNVISVTQTFYLAGHPWVQNHLYA
jgi:hypothetical protein